MKRGNTEMFVDSEAGKVAFNYNNAGDSVVIMGHGYLSDKNSRTNTRLAELLNGQGISTISYDLYGHGESEGEMERLTVSRAVENLLAVHDFAKGRHSQIGLTGSSFTGIVSLIAATKRSFDVLSLKCPVFDSKRLWDERYGEDGLKKWKEDGYVTPFAKKWCYEAYEDACTYDMEKIVPMIKAPVLVIHGDRDTTVPMWHAESIIRLASGEKKLVVVKGADHFFKDENQFNEMIQTSLSWLVSHLE